MKDNCPICKRPREVGGYWCIRCSRAYDRARAKDDGTIHAIIEWGVKRARWFEKRRKAKAARR